jgi:hypothetical protein
MKIETAGYDIVHSGTVITINNKPISIELEDEVEGNYTLAFNFIQDDSILGSVTRLVPITQLIMQINFVNFKGASNTGNRELIHLGSLQKKMLFLNYRVTDLQGIGYSIVFNFLLRRG